MHGDQLKILPETESTVNQCLVYLLILRQGPSCSRLRVVACKYVESKTQRVSTVTGYSGAENGYALLAANGLRTVQFTLYRRNGFWKRLWDDSLPELIHVASVKLKADGQPTLDFVVGH